MPRVSIRRDNYSIQVTDATDTSFFLRIDLSKTTPSRLVFSDFPASATSGLLAAALESAVAELPKLEGEVEVQVRDIVPGEEMSDRLNHVKLVATHDNIVALVTDWLGTLGYQRVDSLLEPQGYRGKFDTKVRLRKFRIIQ